MNRTIFLLLFLSTSIFSQTNKLDSLITSGIHQIYSIEFDKAEKTFTTVREEFPEHPAGKFFDAMIIWWRILLDLRSEIYDDLFKDKLELVLDQCDEILDNDEKNVDAVFFKGGALGYRGRLSALRGDWFDAAADGKDALPLVFYAYDLDSTNTDVILGFGIYNYFAQVIPETYPPVEPLMIFFPEGNKKKGIEQLEFVGKNGKYAKYEAIYFLMTSLYSFEKNNHKALQYAKILNEEFPDNPRFESYRGRINIRVNDYEEAFRIFSSIINKYNLGYTGYTDRVKREAEYYLGDYYNRKDSLELAKTHFLNCVSLSRKVDKDKESGFLINTLLYLGKICDIKGEREKAIKYYEDILDIDDYKNSHEKAIRYLKTPFYK